MFFLFNIKCYFCDCQNDDQMKTHIHNLVAGVVPVFVGLSFKDASSNASSDTLRHGFRAEVETG